MIELGARRIGLDRSAQADGTRQRIHATFAHVPVRAFLLLLGFVLAPDRERVAMGGDVHVLGLDAWQRRLDHELTLRFGDVEGEQCAPTTVALDPAPLKCTQKHEDQYNHEHEPQAPAGAIAPAPAISPSWKGAHKEQDQDNQQDQTETH